jgi:hypothetical protein
MEHKGISIRPFIGAKNFEVSRSFYRDLGFEETVLSNNMSVFKTGALSFYLQDYYLKDWIVPWFLWRLMMLTGFGKNFWL